MAYNVLANISNSHCMFANISISDYVQYDIFSNLALIASKFIVRGIHLKLTEDNTDNIVLIAPISP